jgi:hypothetical protein
MYDLFYLNFLYISFCKKIENVLTRHVRPYVWDKLFGDQEDRFPDRQQKLERLVSRDYRNDLNLIYPAWKKWLSNTRRLNQQNWKGRNLVQIRTLKENKLNEIRNAFNKWKYVKKVLDAEDKLRENERNNNLKDLENERKNREEREKNLRKIKGLFNLLDSVEKYTKKEAMNEALPKIEDYLRKNRGKGRLKRIVNKKPMYDNNLLRKNFYKWLGKTIDESNKDLEERKKREVDELKNKIFKNLIENIHNNQKKKSFKKIFK